MTMIWVEARLAKTTLRLMMEKAGVVEESHEIIWV